MRNHDPARKMKEQEWEETHTRKRKLQRIEKVDRALVYLYDHLAGDKEVGGV